MIDMKIDGLVPGVNSGKCHMIAAGMTKTKKREQAVLFSKTIYFDRIAIAELKKVKEKRVNKTKHLTIKDFDKVGVVIGTRIGSAGDIFLNSVKIKNAKILRYDFQESELISALLLTKVNIIVYDDLFLKIANKKHNNKLVVYKQNEAAEIAVAASKKGEKLINEFNKFFEQWKENKGYEKCKKFYFDDLTWMNKFKS
jgi:polar amino acid transport system substrate-binding protein